MLSRFFLIFIATLATNLHASSCPISHDVEAMHNLFFVTAYTPNHEEVGSFIIRKPEQEEAEIAWACLNKAVELEHCNSMYLQALFYEYGMGEEGFGIEKNSKLAAAIKAKMKQSCSG